MKYFVCLMLALHLLSGSYGLKGAQLDLEEILDLPYYPAGHELAESEEARLNLIIPKGIENPPVMIWIGQGAWAYVSRHVEMNICRRIAENGVVVVSAGHRLSPALLWEPKREEGIQHPEHVKDVAQAVKWLYDHSAEYGFPLDHLFVGGYSSGAHLSALLVMDSRYLHAVDLSPEVITAIIPVAGGYDIPHYRALLIQEDPSYDENHIQAVFGDHEAQVDASPTSYIEHLITPILMISERDTYAYTVVFEEKLSESGFSDFQVIHLHNEGHSSLWKNLGSEAPSFYRDYIVDFIKSRSTVAPE